ncbi:hypothetical protein LXL04_034489 [Taraxacum kok-saghyz]
MDVSNEESSAMGINESGIVDYAKKAGFEVRKSTTIKMASGVGAARLLALADCHIPSPMTHPTFPSFLFLDSCSTCWDLLRTHIFPRTPPILYISQTVIPFKKPTSEPSKTFLIITIRCKKFPKKRYFFLTFAYVQLFFIFCAYVQLFFFAFFFKFFLTNLFKYRYPTLRESSSIKYVN